MISYSSEYSDLVNRVRGGIFDRAQEFSLPDKEARLATRRLLQREVVSAYSPIEAQHLLVVSDHHMQRLLERRQNAFLRMLTMSENIRCGRLNLPASADPHVDLRIFELSLAAVKKELSLHRLARRLLLAVLR